MTATLTLSLGGVNFTLDPVNEGSLEFVQNGSDYLINLSSFSGTLRVSSSSSDGASSSEQQLQGITPKTSHTLKRTLERQSNEVSKRIREELANSDDLSVATDLVMDEIDGSVELPKAGEDAAAAAAEIPQSPPIHGPSRLHRADTAASTPASQLSQGEIPLPLSQAALLGQADVSQTQCSDVECSSGTAKMMMMPEDEQDYDDAGYESSTVVAMPARVSLGASPTSLVDAPSSSTSATPLPRGHDPPCPRWGHTMTAIDRNRAVVYGGQTLDADTNHPVTLQDVHLYDCTNQTWFEPFNCHGLRRQWHTTTFLPQRQLLISFGGEAVDQKSKKAKPESTVMVLDTEIMLWYPPAVSGDAPSCRSGHTATVLGSDLVVFGGVRGRQWLNTVSVLDCDLWQWSVAKVVGAAPPPRSYHSAVAVSESRIVVFGGNNADRSFDSVHCLDRVVVGDSTSGAEGAAKWHWSHPMTTGNRPKARTGHSAVLLADGTTIWVYGGWDPNDDEGNDEDMLFGDSFYLDTTDWTWKIGPSVVDESYGPKRVGHAAVLNGASQICVFGGRVPGDVFSGNLCTVPLTLSD